MPSGRGRLAAERSAFDKPGNYISVSDENGNEILGTPVKNDGAEAAAAISSRPRNLNGRLTTARRARTKTSITRSRVMKNAVKGPFDPTDFRAVVGEGKALLKFDRNQIVFAQGDVADTVFYIQKGKIKVLVVSEQGKEAVVGILEPGHFFGEGCLHGESLRISTTKTLEECLITSITKEAMLATLQSEPKFAEMFMAYLLSRNSRIEEDLIDQLFNSSERRLVRLLLLLANFGKEGSPQPIDSHISQETLAEMIGTTRSRVSFFMNKFRSLASSVITERSRFTGRS